MDFSEKVLVVRTGRFREYDLWVRFLSPSKGMLTGFAFGGCKSRRRFSGCLDVLNLVLFKVSSGPKNKYLTLEEGSLIRGFQGLKSDPPRLGMAVNCVRFVQKICLEGDESSHIYHLLLDCLATIEDSKDIPSFFPLLFRAKAVFIHGYRPNLDLCRRCNLPLSRIKDPGFLFAEGGVVCKTCSRAQDRILQVRQDSLHFVNMLMMSGPQLWTGWTPSMEVLQDCFHMVESFVQYHLEEF
ncbi:DNA repair protein RecO [Desulfonatronovibrio hydrogenovorans]|uniref:DNA repair protein RecO n=1 Tax=Desulfonatronovibrio hydrogenovorans TaxID=53245 RepID=UPI00048DBDEA|nr:DNA repair protein RecO [Desulfonatronovibrio hydrogenovorans]